MPSKNSALSIGISCVLAIAGIGLFVVGAAVSADAQIFKAPQAFPAGPNPVAEASGDFNGDGKPDLAVVNNGSGMVSVLLSNGDGSFKPPVSYAVGSGPVAVSVGDFNGDGKPDLAVANNADSTVSILLGNGDGTFQAAQNSPVANAPQYMTVGDLNGDGKLDLIVNGATIYSIPGVQYMSILLGNGDGTFQAAVNYETGFYALTGDSNILNLRSSWVAVGDFNGDSKLDLALTYTYATRICTGRPPRCTNTVTYGLSIWLGNGDGTFQNSYLCCSTYFAGNLTAGDFNGDGKIDLAIATPDYTSSAKVAVFLGNGDGSFQTPATTYSAGSSDPFSMAASDLNGDGKLDLVLTNGNQVNVLFGNGDGSFQAPATYEAGPSQWISGSIAIDDFNGDGKPDLAVANDITNGVVTVLLNNGDGTFQQPPLLGTDTPFSIAAGDFNGDGKIDLAVGDNSSANPGITVLLGNGDGTFQPAVSNPLSSPPTSVALGDFNGDHKLDLVAVSEAGVWVLLGNGDGTFQPGVNYSSDFGSGYQGIAVGDLNGDNKLDLVVASANAGEVAILLGNGDGTFLGPAPYPSGQACFLSGVTVVMCTASPAIGDFNGDGKPDLAVPNVISNTVNILLGNGDGTFLAPVTYAVGPQPVAVATADFNGDGKPDLAVTNNTNGTVSILLGNGDGTFLQAVNYTVGIGPVGPSAIITGDFNGDGKLDLAVQGSGLASILLGNGDGTFQPQINYSFGDGQAGSYPDIGIAPGDFNGDHTLDLAVAGGLAYGSNSFTLNNFASLSLLLNRSGFFLSVTDAGSSGGGSVTSNPSGIDCGSACSVSFAPGTGVTLTPTPAAGFGFARWSGACSGTGACSVTMNAVESVTATFDPVFALSITDAGNGTGTVISNPGGINCNSSCSANFFSGTAVTLTAAPNSTSNFTGWSGGCSGTSTCSVTMNAVASLTASFTLQDFSLKAASAALTVQPGGQGTDVLTLAAVNGPFINPVQLTCALTGTPPLPPCTFSQASVTPGTNSATSTMTITAGTEALAAIANHRERNRWQLALCMTLLFGLTFIAAPRRQRQQWALCSFLMLMFALQTACGGSGNSNPPPVPKNFNVTVTATSGSITHTTQITVTVQ